MKWLITAALAVAPQAVCANDADANAVYARLAESYAALDPAMMQVEAGALYTALCRKNSACPGLLVLPDHDHISEASAVNTGDTSLSAPVLRFMRGG